MPALSSARNSALTTGELSAARRLLLDDHLARCADAATSSMARRRPPRRRHARTPPPRFIPARWLSYAAAAALLAFGVYMTRDNIDRALAPSGPRATIASIDGALHNIPGDALSAGATLSEGELVRTGAGSRAILTLADGSRLALNQRTELSLSAPWSGQTVRLHHGDLIVRPPNSAAATSRRHPRLGCLRQRHHLRRLQRLSRLARLRRRRRGRRLPARQTLLLTAGKRSAPTPPSPRSTSAGPSPGARKTERYFALLAEFAGIEQQLAALPPPPRAPKPSSSATSPPPHHLLRHPQPLDGTLREALRLVEDRARANSALGDWWNSDTATTSATPLTACRPSCPSSAMRSSSSSPPPRWQTLAPHARPGRP
ncbi:MAG: FecR domain-containing protein [Bryobacterales bacterium]|nr:FecR domain-containing protein [Bryobacterales bacterium]